ncbi:VOC family protein [Staphylococcus sp. ACRSN]|uniref:VOC family protein n=1 Tax=Staphylococcus sp. ACRSN TaxID=2918214 RepID=UPI001EF385DD|nr:VOC family protein [Staphylococcus sp. ACRSN]MCG7338840.1 VOC family protein [Staphylococcus sp. ACRSN]
MNIKRLDHLVLTISSIEETVAFYGDVLGMEVIKFGEDRTALKFGNQKINLHQKDNVIKPNAKNAVPGSADLCFITDVPIDDVIKHVKSLGISIEIGPVERTGASGEINSIYLRDPDENLIEISNYK